MQGMSGNIHPIEQEHKSAVPQNEPNMNMKICMPMHIESKTRTYHERVVTGRRTAGRRGGSGMGSTGRRRVCRRVGSPKKQPSFLAPGDRGIEDNPPERAAGSTDKRNPM